MNTLPKAQPKALQFEDYPIHISPIPKDEGGGYLVTFPDLAGCMADGETVEQAITEAKDAFNAWKMAEIADKGTLPQPKTYSGQFVQRIPKTLHQQLAQRASIEGVSLNQLTTMFITQGLTSNAR